MNSDCNFFSRIIGELRANIAYNGDALQAVLKKSPNLAYQKVNEIAFFTGSRFGVNLQLHFPDSRKIASLDEYGTENIGIVVDKFRKTFPVPREAIKNKAVELVPGSKAQDAYMYEGKEGVKVLLQNGRIEVLPGSIHLWCRIDEPVTRYADWLMQNVYLVK